MFGYSRGRDASSMDYKPLCVFISIISCNRCGDVSLCVFSFQKYIQGEYTILIECQISTNGITI